MTPLDHAHFARALLDACQNLTTAAERCGRSTSTLSRYQDPLDAATMPADVIAKLEAYCGQPIYSRALFDALPAAGDRRRLLSVSLDATATGVELQREVIDAESDGVLTPRERAHLSRIQKKLAAQVRAVGDALSLEDDE